jgi:hypothetical protein
MDIVKVLRNEESKLMKESGHITQQLASIRTAIGALAGKTARTGHIKRKVSAASRAKMAKAQRERWAKVKKSETNKK